MVKAVHHVHILEGEDVTGLSEGEPIVNRAWHFAQNLEGGPAPCLFYGWGGTLSKSESLKPSFLKVSAPIQLKNEFPESTYPINRTFFGPILKVTFTLVLRGLRSRLPI